MPVYEYEPLDHECLMCDGRIGVIQAVAEEALTFCPYCGMGVRRVISKASIQLARDASPDRAGTRGFTTFRRIEEGKWEKVAGEGPDMMLGTETDMAAVKEEKKPRKVIDLDQS